MQRRHQNDLERLLERGTSPAETAIERRSTEVRPHQRSKMFVPAISTSLWLLVYSWPAEVISNPLNVATSPAGLQILEAPQVANVTSYPELLITQAVNDTGSEVFQIPNTNYQVTLTNPTIERTIAVEALRDLLRRVIIACHTQIEDGRASTVPHALRLIGPPPNNLRFVWSNCDGLRRGSFAELMDIFSFLQFISTIDRIPRPNPWVGKAFFYVVNWVADPDSPELIGKGRVGI